MLKWVAEYTLVNILWLQLIYLCGRYIKYIIYMCKTLGSIYSKACGYISDFYCIYLTKKRCFYVSGTGYAAITFGIHCHKMSNNRQKMHLTSSQNQN